MFVWLWTDAWLGTAALSFGSARDRTGHPPDWCVFMPVPGAGVHTFAIPRSTSGGRGAEDGIKGRFLRKLPNMRKRSLRRSEKAV